MLSGCRIVQDGHTHSSIPKGLDLVRMECSICDGGLSAPARPGLACKRQHCGSRNAPIPGSWTVLRLMNAASVLLPPLGSHASQAACTRPLGPDYVTAGTICRPLAAVAVFNQAQRCLSGRTGLRMATPSRRPSSAKMVQTRDSIRLRAAFQHTLQKTPRACPPWAPSVAGSNLRASEAVLRMAVRLLKHREVGMEVLAKERTEVAGLVVIGGKISGQESPEVRDYGKNQRSRFRGSPTQNLHRELPLPHVFPLPQTPG